MADDVKFEVTSFPSSVPPETIIETEQQGTGEHRQVVKVGESALPAGGATASAQSALLTELQLKADLTETQPVGAASLPLPAGAATSAIQTDGTQATQFVDEVGTPYGVKHINNKLRVSSVPYYVDIVEGNVPDHQAVYKFGNNESAGTTEQTIWSSGGLYPWDAIVAAAGIVKVSSSSAQDAAAGTGVATVQIYGINSSTGVDQNETIILTGQTAVNSNLTYSSVYRIICLTAGSASTTGKNIGVIYVGTGAVGSGVPALVWATVAIGRNQTLMAVYTVPAGKTLYITDMSFSVGGAKGAEGVMYVKPLGELFQVKALSHLAGGFDYIPFTFPLMLTAGTQIDMRATAAANSTEITATFSGWYE